VTRDRLGAVLLALRWPPKILASALAIKAEQVQQWLDGTKHIPANVAAWLEGLAAAHQANPHPEGWFERQKQAAGARIVYARKPRREPLRA
jgi:hypothetical protein